MRFHQMNSLVLFVLVTPAAYSAEAQKSRIIRDSAGAAGVLYSLLPGPVVEIRSALHKKQNADKSIVCYKEDYMYNENEYTCEVSGDSQNPGVCK